MMDTTSLKPQKAYCVYEKAENASFIMGIVFEESASRARHEAWTKWHEEMVVEEYTNLRSTREPWADAYAASGTVPLRAYLEYGWYWWCRDCRELICIENIGGVTDQDDPVCESCATHRGLSRPDWVSPSKEVE